MEKISLYGFAIVAITLFSFLIVINRKLSLDGMNAFQIAAILPFFILILATMNWFYFGNPTTEIKEISRDQWIWLFFAAFINAISFLIMVIVLKNMSATEYNLLTLLAPIFAAIFSYFLLKEVITYHLFIGLIFIGIGIFIALYKPNIL